MSVENGSVLFMKMQKDVLGWNDFIRDFMFFADMPHHVIPSFIPSLAVRTKEQLRGGMSLHVLCEITLT